MRCPKCGYNSFDYNAKCDNGKCNKDWSIPKNLLGLIGFVEPKDINFFDITNARLAAEEAEYDTANSFPEEEIELVLPEEEPVEVDIYKPRIVDENAFPTPDPMNFGAILSSNPDSPNAEPGANINAFPEKGFSAPLVKEAGGSSFPAAIGTDFNEMAEIDLIPEPMMTANDELSDATIFPQEVEEFDEIDLFDSPAEVFPEAVVGEVAAQDINLGKFPKPGEVNFISPDGNPFPKVATSSVTPQVELISEPSVSSFDELDIGEIEMAEHNEAPTIMGETGDETFLPVNNEAIDQIKNVLTETGELAQVSPVKESFTQIPDSDETFMISDIDLAGDTTKPNVPKLEPVKKQAVLADSTNIATNEENLASMLDDDFNLDELDDEL